MAADFINPTAPSSQRIDILFNSTLHIDARIARTSFAFSSRSQPDSRADETRKREKNEIRKRERKRNKKAEIEKRVKKRETRTFAFRTRGAYYTTTFILIPRTCRHPEPWSRRQGQCHCHSETVKVWSFCWLSQARFCALPTRSRTHACTHVRARARHTHRRGFRAIAIVSF